MADEEKAPVVQAEKPEKPEKQKKQKKVPEGGLKEVCGMRCDYDRLEDKCGRY